MPASFNTYNTHSKTVPEGRREEGIQALGIKHSEGYRVRLKLLCLVGCSKLRLFSFLSNRLWKEREGWKEKLLSKREEVRKFSS